MNKAAIPKLPGQAFLGRDGHRWRVKCSRPGPEGQFVIEEEIPGSYPRIAVYTMTEGEFREHARSAHLRPERRGTSRPASTHPR